MGCGSGLAGGGGGDGSLGALGKEAVGERMKLRSYHLYHWRRQGVLDGVARVHVQMLEAARPPGPDFGSGAGVSPPGSHCS